jgi:hypothetical protein
MLVLVVMPLVLMPVIELRAGDDRRVIPSICSLILLLLLMRVMLLLLWVIILLLLGESSMPPVEGVWGGMLLVDGGRNNGRAGRRGGSIPANSCWDANPRPKPMDPELRVLARDDDGAGGDTNPGSCFAWTTPAGYIWSGGYGWCAIGAISSIPGCVDGW